MPPTSQGRRAPDDSRANGAPESAILARDVRYRHRGSTFTLEIARLEVPRGARWGLYGPSGCGKSTLLDLLSGVHHPERGELRVEGCDLATMGDRERRAFRIRNVGFVFQDFPLVDYLDVEENVLYPYRVSAALVLDRGARARAVDLLAEVGLGDKRRRRPGELSQGERQRVAIARALVTEPALLLADEPTAGLDPAQAAAVVDLLRGAAGRDSRTLLVVSHDPAVLERLERRLSVDGLAKAGGGRDAA